MGKELQIKMITDFLQKKNIAFDLVDMKSEVDSKLSFSENKKHIMELLNLSEDLTKKQIDSEIQSVQVENIKKITEEVQQQTSTALDQIAKQDNYLIPQLNHLSEGVRMLCKNHFSGLFCVSNGGWGKSFSVIQTLAKEKQEYVLINTHISPVALFELLYNNSDKVILFEDCEKILENEVIISILRSALWSALTDSQGEMIRNITFHSAWENAKHLPKSFIFKGKIILLANKMPKDSRTEALLSRVLFYDLHFSIQDIQKMFVVMAKKGYKDLDSSKCLEIVEKLQKKVGVEIKNLNLRLFHKAVELYRYNSNTWENSLNSFLDIDEDLKLVGELIRSSDSTNIQVQKFIDETGLGRRTFFRMKKKYLNLLGGRK